jgi:nitrous oxidase accessory protein
VAAALRIAVSALALTFACSPVTGATIEVGPGAGDVQEIVDRANPGDVIHLKPGTHLGQVRMNKPITLEGESGAVLQGPGAGSVVAASAPDTVIRGLIIRGSGTSLAEMDSGVFLEQAASGARVEGNVLEENLFGVYVHGASNAVVQGNQIVGKRDLRMSEAGNGVTVWNAPGAKVLDNDIRFGRDGIYVVSSSKNLFQGNRMRDLRFAVHICMRATAKFVRISRSAIISALRSCFRPGSRSTEMFPNMTSAMA